MSDIFEYLGVTLEDYWYADAERMVWCVSKADGGYYEKPVRWEDLTDKGKQEHPELKQD